MKKIIFLLLFPLVVFAQEVKTEDVEVNLLIKGTLFSLENTLSKPNLVIIIAGSGPTNRNGNQPGMQNNSLKYLAEAIAKDGNVAFSFDKRIISQMKEGTLDEKSLRFDDFITDVKEIITYFKNQKKYNKIIIAGHSEGSLIGMIAAKDNADAYISLAGAGRTIDLIITEQIEKQAPFLKAKTEENFKILKEGKTFELENQMLASIFRESVQPYMITWMNYNPQEEIKKLKMPILIINGTKDIQVAESEAKLLHEANPNSELKIIDKMNHIFKEINADEENIKSYSNPDLPIINKLSETINSFIKSL
ncbi:alpha/beta hydrolase [uncultured Flavobacterium sp.]|uniref:alpha/beta hydrolase n=1 Tax=uncultured Flavobacterium sp. TaxID=165435 RepID=UPI0030ED7497|tara:strand:+ start:272997 stop:273917 length:921 start_codon:yes stop_codon:yes gene_type:complete